MSPGDHDLRMGATGALEGGNSRGVVAVTAGGEAGAEAGSASRHPMSMSRGSTAIGANSRSRIDVAGRQTPKLPSTLHRPGRWFSRDLPEPIPSPSTQKQKTGMPTAFRFDVNDRRRRILEFADHLSIVANPDFDPGFEVDVLADELDGTVAETDLSTTGVPAGSRHHG